MTRTVHVVRPIEVCLLNSCIANNSAASRTYGNRFVVDNILAANDEDRLLHTDVSVNFGIALGAIGVHVIIHQRLFFQYKL